MYSASDTLAGGFPHSDISGSKLICQLPEAFRRLSRPSSPIIAKASTTCSYSLDPITLTFLSKAKHVKEFSGFRQTRYAASRPEPGATNKEPRFNVRFDAIKIVADGTARTATRTTHFPSATLIRLNELLKNSRLTGRFRSTTKQPPDSEAALVLR